MKSKILIGIIAVIVIVLIVCGVKNINKDNGKKEGYTKIKDIYTAFNINEIDTKKYNVEKSKSEKVASKYKAENNTYVLKDKISLNENEGKMIYVRNENNKLNIYQEKTQIDSMYESVDLQINMTLEKFKQDCMSFTGHMEEDLEEKTLNDSTNGKVPLGEAIFNNNAEYYASFTIDNKKYEISCFRVDESIICELVYEI